jgi:hypothetical protein
MTKEMAAVDDALTRESPFKFMCPLPFVWNYHDFSDLFMMNLLNCAVGSKQVEILEKFMRLNRLDYSDYYLQCLLKRYSKNVYHCPYTLSVYLGVKFLNKEELASIQSYWKEFVVYDVAGNWMQKHDQPSVGGYVVHSPKPEGVVSKTSGPIAEIVKMIHESKVTLCIN